MLASRKLWILQTRMMQLGQSSIPVLAGFAMLCASLLPWLTDPLGEVYSAWKLPIDLGWQFHIAAINYGLLCLCCAVYAFFIAYANWRPFKSHVYLVQRPTLAGVLCIIPVVVFLVQYLCADIEGMNRLAQHKMQMLLVQAQFGYRVTQDRIVMSAFALNISTLQGRLVLLVDQISFGLVLPCLSAWMLIYYRRFSTLPPSAADSKAIRLQKVHKRIWLTSIAILILVLLIVLGRTPAAMVCDYQARESLAAGDYAQALRWLDTALVLNPALDQVVYYHEERGQALYYLHPDQQSDDSRVYLASTYRKQGDNLDAYQQLLEAWSSHHTPSWGVDAMSITLEKLAEFSQPLNSPPTQRPQNDDTALAWLQLLTQVDPSNVYGQYVVGRIQYDLHNYTACTTQMIMVIQLSPDANVQSSAYTYIALSDAGLGNDAEARKLLFKAIELDRSYRNNTAREELSGLH